MSSEAKKPCKGILKTSSSFDKHQIHRKSAKFDELNVLQTYHPPNKDYGHMKIDEPKTPYNYENPEQNEFELDANALAEKLTVAADQGAEDDDEVDGARGGGAGGTKGRTYYTTDEDPESDEEKAPESDEQKVHRQDFEKRRKAHYKEFEAVKLARKLIEEEDEGEVEGDQEDDLDSSKIIVVETTDVVLPPELPGSSSMDTSPSTETPVGEPSLV